jgi:hypothetical protein
MIDTAECGKDGLLLCAQLNRLILEFEEKHKNTGVIFCPITIVSPAYDMKMAGHIQPAFSFSIHHESDHLDQSGLIDKIMGV